MAKLTDYQYKHIPLMYTVISEMSDGKYRELMKDLHVFDCTQLMKVASHQAAIFNTYGNLDTTLLSGLFVDNPDFSGYRYIPPFEIMWMEGKDSVRSPIEGIELLGQSPDRALVDYITKSFKEFTFNEYDIFKEVIAGDSVMSIGGVVQRDYHDDKVIITIEPFVSFATSAGISIPFPSMVDILAALTLDGFMTNIALRQNEKYVKDGIESAYHHHIPIAASTFILVMYSIAMLNSRTEVEKVVPNRRDRTNMARMAGRKKPFKQRSYYLLNVDYDAEKLVPRPTSQPTGAKRPFHTVRGHFRRLGRGPREGELTWVRSHTRGSKNIGIVEKGYRLV